MWEIILPILGVLIPLYSQPLLSLFSSPNPQTDPNIIIPPYRRSLISSRVTTPWLKKWSETGWEKKLKEMIEERERGGGDGVGIRGWVRGLGVDFRIYEWNRTLYHILENIVSGENHDGVEAEEIHSATSALLFMLLGLMVGANAFSPTLGYYLSSLFAIFYRFEACSLWISPTTHPFFSPIEGLRFFLVVYILEWIDAYVSIADQSTEIWRAVGIVILTSRGIFKHGGALKEQRSRMPADPPVMKKARGLYHTDITKQFKAQEENNRQDERGIKSVLEMSTDAMLVAIPVIGITRHNAQKTMDEMGRYQKMALAGMTIWATQWLLSSGLGNKQLSYLITSSIAILESLRCVKTYPIDDPHSKEENSQQRKAECRNMLCCLALIETIAIIENFPAVLQWLVVFFPKYLWWKTVLILVLIFATAPKARGDEDKQPEGLAEWLFVYIHFAFGEMDRATRSKHQENSSPRRRPPPRSGLSDGKPPRRAPTPSRPPSPSPAERRRGVALPSAFKVLKRPQPNGYKKPSVIDDPDDEE